MLIYYFIKKILIFVIASFLIFIFIHIFLYLQIGPTCGFYSLIYGINKVNTIKKKKAVRNIIKQSIESGKSYIGEIFDINTMEQIVKDYYPKVTSKVVAINEQSELDKYLEKYYMVKY